MQFRPAAAGDADAVVPLMYESSKGLFDAILKAGRDDPQAFLRHDFLRGDGIFGLRNQVVAVDGGALVATITMYAGGRYGELSKETVKSVLGHFGPFKAVGIGARARPLGALFIQPRADGLFLANACVIPTRRGQGIFVRLLDHGVERARRDGLAAVELDVSFKNTAARAAYERLGFVVTTERPYLGKAGLDGFRRMQRLVA